MQCPNGMSFLADDGSQASGQNGLVGRSELTFDQKLVCLVCVYNIT